MVVNGIAVMRRRSDSWLNATQILKVAGVDKGKRTKVLEKEILSGEHEKVQGGYGRYQGTWINYQRGREFCRAYGVEEVLRPLLEYDMGQDGAAPGEGSRIETPTKEQAMAAQRKKLMYNGSDGRNSLQTPNTTFFQNISPIAANAVNAINKARFDSPGPRLPAGTKRPGSVKRSINQVDSQFQGSQQSMQSDSSFGIDPLFTSHTTPYFTKPNRSQTGIDQEPPRKRARPSSSADPFSHITNGDYERSLRERSPTEPNESFMYPQFAQHDTETGIVGVPPLPEPTSSVALEKQAILSSLFLDPSRDSLEGVPGLENLSGEDFDLPIGAGAQTALHWAASLAKPSLLRALIAKGANIFRVNGGGETALMRAVRTTNNLDQNSFPELLDLLGATIEMRDQRGQTLLHHIAVTSAIKGRSAACRYYLDSLLEYVVHQGSVSNSQHESFSQELSQRQKPMGLARFMAEIVNAQDLAGDTALNLAARINSRSIIQQLLEVGANPSIPNRGGLKPLDFGVGNAGIIDVPNSSQNSLSNSQKQSENRVGDSSRLLLDCKCNIPEIDKANQFSS
jgi:regulatory protein SWI6